MNRSNCRPDSSEKLIELVDTFLGPTTSLAEYDTMARIALAFCKATSRSLDERQRNAIDVAERFLLGDSSDHERCLIEVVRRVNQTSRDPALDKAEKSMDRLIWFALATNTELSGYACEFVVGLGEDIGLDLDVMTDIVVRTVPGMAEWCAGRAS